MNQKFIKKMLQAKYLEYDAFKEIMPDCLVKHMELAEEEVREELKKVMLRLYTSYMQGTETKDTYEKKQATRNSTRKKVVVE